MNAFEFNKKYAEYLEHRFYGMAIQDEEVIAFLDREFEKEIEVNPDFQYSQIKTKFGNACVYCNSNKEEYWVAAVNSILERNKKL